ncbi:hypothetical protein [Oscillatoria salina]|uniref:hypothetical protein n=1 Tax=Oscillatoria salina TaxID=331517 RepID=UPI0013BCADAA|nr:hypothetical protein [Oscillatoria salina]MBZ8181453.1 hypothetical protein [Oscillatoria salina IIICB1]NET88409.1 hypothetical protein [Kamptonema sp. SIO1D9]
MMTVDLNEIQWQVAHNMAQKLVLKEVDENELKKAIAYLRFSQNKENAGKNFFDYLQTLARNGRKIGHSGRTLDYYRSMEAICRENLRGYQDNVEVMLQILGWAFRLTKYYQNSVPLGELKGSIEQSNIPENISTRQAKIAEVLEEVGFAEGQIIEAEITNKTKGNKVTYQIYGTIKLSQKEPREYDNLAVGEKVKVEIIELNNEKPKKVKFIKKIS